MILRHFERSKYVDFNSLEFTKLEEYLLNPDMLLNYFKKKSTTHYFFLSICKFI